MAMAITKTVIFDAESFLSAGAANPGKPVLMEVPELGGSVYLRGLTAAERDDYESESFRVTKGQPDVNMRNMRARLLVRSLCDEQGNRLFRNHDVEKLGKFQAKILDRLFAKAQELTGISDADIEELTGKSETTNDGDSDSG